MPKFSSKPFRSPLSTKKAVPGTVVSALLAASIYSDEQSLSQKTDAIANQTNAKNIKENEEEKMKKQDDENQKEEEQMERILSMIEEIPYIEKGRKEYDEEQDRSEPKIPSKQNPKSGAILVGDDIDETVFNNKTQDILLEFYSDNCPHCVLFNPTFKQLAYAFEIDPNIVVAKINTDKNWRNGLLTFDQYIGGTPTIKLFQAGLGHEDKLKEAKEGTSPNYTALINWVYMNRKSPWTEQGREAVQKRADELLERTKEELSTIIDKKQIDWVIQGHPCGEIVFAWMKARELYKYGLQPSIHEMASEYSKCFTQNEEKINKYWAEIERRKRQEENQQRIPSYVRASRLFF